MTDAVACFALLETNRVNAVAKRASQSQQPLTVTLCSGPVGASDILVTCTSDPFIKHHRFAHSPNRAGHASPLRSGRCSATDADSSRPGRVVGPSLGRPGGAPGVPGLPFAGLLPHTGGGSFLIGPGPPACSSSRRAPIDFRRVDSPLLRDKKENESRHCRGKITCAWIGFWALTPVCGPCPDVSAGNAPSAKPPGIVPALGLSSFRHAGTRRAIGRARPRTNHQVANAL